MISLVLSLLIFCSLGTAQTLPPGHPPLPPDSGSVKATNVFVNPVPPEQAFEELKASAEAIQVGALAEIPVQHNGRVKPLHSLARESVLFVTGRYRFSGLDPVALFFGLALSQSAPFVNLIEVRDPELRVQLGFLRTQRHLSLADLDKSPIHQLAQPLMEKEQRNSRSVSPSEKKVLELYNQMSLARSMTEGSLFLQSIDFKPLTESQASAADSPVIEAGQKFFKGLAQGQSSGEVTPPLIEAIKAQDLPEFMKWQMDTIGREVLLNKAGVFFWSAILLFVLGSLLVTQSLSHFLSDRAVSVALILPVLLISVGLAVRVTITGFAPVTNMYGTMIWVAFGTLIFSWLLFLLYKNRTLTGMLSIAAALVLILTESVPLVLSPDLDPIVAVLRSNYWLTIHVLTITISYAAFTITMVLGNIALVRSLIFSPERNAAFFKTYSHYAYRMIQLGVFLLTAGIILGGVWADYSWGRFWGWDPKETWALIADVGFLAILHARFTGWLGPFGLLAACPMAYLLVVMAWYGVNFILAAGLHSYGFSSGGAWAVGIFVGIQVLLLLIAMAKHFEVWKDLTRRKKEPQ